MNRQLVGEPGVSAFLKSLLRNMADMGRMERTYTTYLYYDPSPHLQKLKRKLISLQDVLVDGEARRLDDASVDEWMDDLKHLFYDLDNILEDIRRTLSVQPDGINQVQFDYTLLRGRSIVIKEGLEEILSRTDELVDRSKDLDLRRGVGYVTWGMSGQAIRRTIETSPEVDMSEIHGREEDKKFIVEKLLVAKDNGKKKYDVFSIVGMGGLGKTTLAKLIFDDSDVVKHFDLKSWVCISNVFDVARATKELIENSGGGSGDRQSLARLQTRLKETIANKKFLFVLDDVWSSSEWETMKGPFRSCASGSKILVTTRNTKIAHALGNKEPYQLEGLDHEHCMAILRDKAFLDDKEEHKKLVLGKKIVKACGGVPLAVNVIGSMLQGADEEKWRAVSENADLWNMKSIKDGIHPAIRLSYHYLPASLKRCFEYLAIFPPDFGFEQDDVVRLWIADGLVQEEDGRMAEDIGNEYYNELKGRSLIQKNNMMHDIVHHLATLLSRKFCYKENSKEPPASVRHAFVVIQNAMQYKFLPQAPCLRTLNVFIDMNVWKLLPEGISFIERFTHIRYLAIKCSDLKHFPNSLCMLNNLQFLVLQCYYLESLPDRISSLSNLRQLILVWCYSISSLPESICALSKLQVLALEHCKGLKQLPRDMGNLRSLRTIDLRDTLISSLPESICALSQLQVLNLEACFNLKQLPNNIGNLKSLRKLNLRGIHNLSMPESILNVPGLVNLLVDEDKPVRLLIESIARLEELIIYQGHLMDWLGQLAIAMENVGGVEEAEKADLKSKKFITGLEFRWSEPGNDEEMEVKIVEALEPHHAALESLTFTNYGGDKLPAWMMSSDICLSNLVELKMEGLDKICEMIDMEFVALVTLKIENCPMLRKVLIATPKLRELTMKKCGRLEEEQHSIHFIPSLSDQAALHSIVSHLIDLKCDYNIFEYFFDKLKTANSKWDEILSIELSVGGRSIASLPWGWPSMMESLIEMKICDIGPGEFQFIPDGDQSDFPPSLLTLLWLNERNIVALVRHHSYIITGDGEVLDPEVSEEETITDPEEMELTDSESSVVSV